MININDFDPNSLKIDKKSYITIKTFGEYTKINSVNPLYLVINHTRGHIVVLL